MEDNFYNNLNLAGSEDDKHPPSGANPDVDTPEPGDALNPAPAENLADAVAALRREINDLATNLGSKIVALQKDIAQVNSQMDGVRNLVADKDKELQRWREGYDWAKWSEIVGEIVAWLDFLESRERNLKRKNNKAAMEEVVSLRETVEDSLSNHSLSRVRPQEGEDFDKFQGKAEKAEAIETDDATLDGKIQSATRSGILLYEGQDTERIVRKAKVKIWRLRTSTTQKETEK